jgi:hypothetical protein
MRAREFTINVPITITINGDEDPVVSTDAEQEKPELQQNPVMVAPLQQELELAKAEQGKESPVIDKITADDEIGAEPADQDTAKPQDELQRLLQLLGR